MLVWQDNYTFKLDVERSKQCPTFKTNRHSKHRSKLNEKFTIRKPVSHSNCNPTWKSAFKVPKDIGHFCVFLASKRFHSTVKTTFKSIFKYYHMTGTARAQLPWKTIREKVPYEGRTRRSARAGKTRTALLEMRTALLATATAESTRVHDKNNFVAAKVCSLQNESWKWTFWERNFTIQANCPMQNYFISRQLTPKAKKEI